MDPEVAITAIEEIKEAITINIEVDTKATKTTGNLSIWMIEEIISGTLMETQLTHQRNMMQPLPFILQVWKVIEVIEAEGLREEEEDPIKDMDQDEVQAEELVEDMDQIEEQIGEQREDITKDKDPIEDQEEDQTKDMDLAKEVEEEHTIVPKTKLKEDIAWCARSKDTITYFTAPSYQNMFPEDLASKLFQKNYVNSASQLLVTTQIVLILIRETTVTGCVNRVKQASYSVRIVRSIKLPKIG